MVNQLLEIQWNIAKAEHTDRKVQNLASYINVEVLKEIHEAIDGEKAKGTYIASESTFYHVLREEKMQNHRGRSEAPKSKKPTTYRATATNQVYMWDITYLTEYKSNVKSGLSSLFG